MNSARVFSPLLVALALTAVQVGAQVEEIPAGEPLSSRLESTDPVLADGSHYRLFLYRGTAGEEVVVTMRSGEFDTYLSVGWMEDDTTFIAEDGNDDGGGATDSRVRAIIGESGTLVLQANSYGAGATGAFTLEVELLPTLTMVRRLVTAGERVSARMFESDPFLDNGAHYHIYVYQGTPGERIVVTMRSAEVDALLHGGRLEDDAFVSEDSDDDGGGDTDAMLSVTVGASGEYVIRATTYWAEELGEYSLLIEVQGSR